MFINGVNHFFVLGGRGMGVGEVLGGGGGPLSQAAAQRLVNCGCGPLASPRFPFSVQFEAQCERSTERQCQGHRMYKDGAGHSANTHTHTLRHAGTHIQAHMSACTHAHFECQYTVNMTIQVHLTL